MGADIWTGYNFLLFGTMWLWKWRHFCFLMHMCSIIAPSVFTPSSRSAVLCSIYIHMYTYIHTHTVTFCSHIPWTLCWEYIDERGPGHILKELILLRDSGILVVNSNTGLWELYLKTSAIWHLLSACSFPGALLGSQGTWRWHGSCPQGAHRTQEGEASCVRTQGGPCGKAIAGGENINSWDWEYWPSLI